MAKQQLSNWTIVSLRPQGQHASVRHVAALWQAKCCTFSIYKLIATPNNQTLSNALSAQIRIISSPSAVHFASQKARLSGHWLAVGQQTAKLLYEAGASSVSVAKPQSAEGLLNLDELQMVQGISIGIITAPKGRGLLEETLQQRGAKLQMAYVYRRQVLKLNAKQLARIDQMSAKTAILVSSQSAFETFWQQLNETRKVIIKSAICIASSTRLLEYLQSLGLSHVLCSDSTLAQDQMSTLAEAVLSTE